MTALRVRRPPRWEHREDRFDLREWLAAPRAGYAARLHDSSGRIVIHLFHEEPGRDVEREGMRWRNEPRIFGVEVFLFLGELRPGIWRVVVADTLRRARRAMRRRRAEALT